MSDDEFILTGLTQEEMDEQVKRINAGEDVPMKCYLCKREEGKNSVAIPPDGYDSPVVFAPVTLHDTPILGIDDEVEFSVFLCNECYLIIRSICRLYDQENDEDSGFDFELGFSDN